MLQQSSCPKCGAPVPLEPNKPYLTCPFCHSILVPQRQGKVVKLYLSTQAAEILAAKGSNQDTVQALRQLQWTNERMTLQYTLARVEDKISELLGTTAPSGDWQRLSERALSLQKQMRQLQHMRNSEEQAHLEKEIGRLARKQTRWLAQGHSAQESATLQKWWRQESARRKEREEQIRALYQPELGLLDDFIAWFQKSLDPLQAKSEAPGVAKQMEALRALQKPFKAQRVELERQMQKEIDSLTQLLGPGGPLTLKQELNSVQARLRAGRWPNAMEPARRQALRAQEAKLVAQIRLYEPGFVPVDINQDLYLMAAVLAVILFFVILAATSAGR